MALINVPTDHLRHTRFAQDWMAEGEARGRLEGETVAPSAYSTAAAAP